MSFSRAFLMLVSKARVKMREEKSQVKQCGKLVLFYLDMCKVTVLNESRPVKNESVITFCPF